MRADWHARAGTSLQSKRVIERARGYSCQKSDQLLLGSTVLRERLGYGLCVFLRLRTTSHVCATFASANLLARRVRQDARYRGKPQRRHNHRRHQRK